jgi:hypothetical protein
MMPFTASIVDRASARVSANWVFREKNSSASHASSVVTGDHYPEPHLAMHAGVPVRYGSASVVLIGFGWLYDMNGKMVIIFHLLWKPRERR